MNDPTIAYMELVHKMVDSLREDLRSVQGEMKDYRKALEERPTAKDMEGFTRRLTEDIERLSNRMELIIGQPESLISVSERSKLNRGQIATLVAIAMGVAGFIGWLVPLLADGVK